MTDKDDPEVIEGLSDADWAQLESEAGKVLLRHLRTDDPSLKERVKTATTIISASTRREATKGAREALHFAVARTVAQSPEQLAEYVRATQPSFPRLASGEGPARPGLARQGWAKQGKATKTGDE